MLLPWDFHTTSEFPPSDLPLQGYLDTLRNNVGGKNAANRERPLSSGELASNPKPKTPNPEGTMPLGGATVCKLTTGC